MPSPLKEQAPYAVVVRKSVILFFVNTPQETLAKTSMDTTNIQQYLAKAVFKKTAPRALQANPTTKTCRRMCSPIKYTIQ